jgi:hypothetical protein
MYLILVSSQNKIINRKKTHFKRGENSISFCNKKLAYFVSNTFFIETAKQASMEMLAVTKSI